MRTGSRGIFPSYYAVEVAKEEAESESSPAKSSEWMDRYRMKFLGSVQVPYHKGNDVLCAAMQKIATNRRATVSTTKPALIDASWRSMSTRIKLVVQDGLRCCVAQWLFWLHHQAPADQRFACHVLSQRELTQTPSQDHKVTARITTQTLTTTTTSSPCKKNSAPPPSQPTSQLHHQHHYPGLQLSNTSTLNSRNSASTLHDFHH
ncbi:unnamed protein product [Gadus morhua 'NCC']